MYISDLGLLGAVIIARHGDREGFYQDPFTYNASLTSITPLGSVQEFQLGGLLRSRYLERDSPFFIQGISTDLFNQTQVQVRADAGGERGVIFDSSVALLQGLFPATTEYNTTLANGTTVVGPLGGYQYVPIESVEPDEDVSLEGWTDCNTFDNATLAFYNSALFQQVAEENESFLQSLQPFLDGRSVSLINMWNIFDFMNVQFIHNATFANNLPDGFIERARALANFHEYGVFSSPQIDGIGNIAGRAMLPSIITGMERITNTSDPLKLVYEAISYKPFISLFNMTGVAETYPQLAGIVEYAASMVFELRNGTTEGDPLVRLIFKNGTNDVFNTYNMFGQAGDVPLSLFKSRLEFTAINTTAEWCAICDNHVDRGCATCNNPAVASATATAAAEGSYTPSLTVLIDAADASPHHTLNPTAAGFIGAAVTAAAFCLVMCALAFVGQSSAGRQAKRGRREGSSRSSTEKINHEFDSYSCTKLG